jgi:ABC-type transport system substrate-binding protein
MDGRRDGLLRHSCKVLFIPESSRNEVVDLSHPSLQQPPSLPDLTNMVSPLLKHKWREIGIQLDIRPSDLDSFYDRRNRNPNNCFVDVFSAWESEAKLPYTWATILKAISSSYVDEKAIAMRIRDEIITRYNSS